MEVRRLPSWIETEEDLELYHHGVKGQRWGVRRYQNEDGTLTDKGRAKLNKYIDSQRRSLDTQLSSYQEALSKRKNKFNKKIEKSKNKGNSEKAEKLKKKLKSDKRIADIQKNISNAEKQITMVKNMSFSDMTREKKLRYKETAQKALISGSVAALMTMGTAALAIAAPGVIPLAAVQNSKTAATISAVRFANTLPSKVEKDRLKRWDAKYNKG